MKVTIQHSINLEDVPGKAHELLMPVEEKIDNAMRWLNALSRDLSMDNITAELASATCVRIREALSECDLSLQEVGSIMQGVADYEKESLLPPSPPPISESKAEGWDKLEHAMEQITEEKDLQEAELEEKLQALASEKHEALLKEKELVNEPILPF